MSLPTFSRFVDVAQAAGLTEPTICDEQDSFTEDVVGKLGEGQMCQLPFVSAEPTTPNSKAARNSPQ
jgi:hypothetical protein